MELFNNNSMDARLCGVFQAGLSNVRVRNDVGPGLYRLLHENHKILRSLVWTHTTRMM